MSVIQKTWDTLRGKTAAKATERAAQTQAGAQQEALEYLREREALPQQFREGALTQLAGLYGLGDEADPFAGQTALIERARQSPLYQAIMGTQGAAEDALRRQAAATGAGIRGGDFAGAAGRLAQNLEQEALLKAYGQQVEGLTGLAQLPSGASGIASLMSGIGATEAAGISGAAQARQKGLMDLLKLAGQAAGGAAGMGMFSDIHLKTNIRNLGQRNGHNWYGWEWVDEAKELGLSGYAEGYMAHEIAATHPEALSTRDGYLMIDMQQLEAA